MSDVTRGAQSTQTDPFRARPSRRTVVAGAAWAVPAVVGVNALPAWATSPGAVPVCPAGEYSTTGTGRFLSGSLFGYNLDAVAEVKGVKVDNSGMSTDPVVAVTRSPISAVQIPNDPFAYQANIDANLLGLINAQLALPLYGLGLVKLLSSGAQLGVLDQYAKAVHNGYSEGASGALTDGGAVDLDPPQSGWPEIATIDVLGVVGKVSPALKTALNLLGLTDLSLGVGAVAAMARLSACSTNIGLTTDTDYLVAGLTLKLRLAALSTLLAAVGGLTKVLNDLQGIISIDTDGTLNIHIGNLFTLGGQQANTPVVVNISSVVSTVTNLLDGLLGTTLKYLLSPVTTALNQILGFIFNGGSLWVGGSYVTIPAILNIVVNWQTEDGVVTDVAALRVGVLQGPGYSLTTLYLARAMVGPNQLVSSP